MNFNQLSLAVIGFVVLTFCIRQLGTDAFKGPK